MDSLLLMVHDLRFASTVKKCDQNRDNATMSDDSLTCSAWTLERLEFAHFVQYAEKHLTTIDEDFSGDAYSSVSMRGTQLFHCLSGKWVSMPALLVDHR